MWLVVVLVSALAAAAGYAMLGPASGHIDALVQAFAGGALLAMVADTLLPEAYAVEGVLTGTLVVIGFAISLALSRPEPAMSTERSRMRERREQMERAGHRPGGWSGPRSRSMVVDTMVGVVGASVPWRSGSWPGPWPSSVRPAVLCYVLVAGLGFAAEASASRPNAGREPARRPVISSVAAASRSSERAAGWPARRRGGDADRRRRRAEVLRWVRLLAWRMRPTRRRIAPWGGSGWSPASPSSSPPRPGPSRPVRRPGAGQRADGDPGHRRGVGGGPGRAGGSEPGHAAPRGVPWTALVPGACLFAVGLWPST